MKFILDGTANVVMHPSRYRILQFLRKSDEPKFVEQISKEVDVHPRMVSHHLDVLEKQNLVECKYEIIKVNGSKRRIAVRRCISTEKTEEVFTDLKETFEAK